LKGDGRSDDTEALRHLLRSSKNVHLPAGIYLVRLADDEMLDLASGLVLSGAGAAQTIIRATDNRTIPTAIIGQRRANGAAIRDLTLEYARQSKLTDNPMNRFGGVFFSEAGDCIVERVAVRNCQGFGAWANNPRGSIAVRSCILDSIGATGVLVSADARGFAGHKVTIEDNSISRVDHRILGGATNHTADKGVAIIGQDDGANRYRNPDFFTQVSVRRNNISDVYSEGISLHAVRGAVVAANKLFMSHEGSQERNNGVLVTVASRDCIVTDNDVKGFARFGIDFDTTAYTGDHGGHVASQNRCIRNKRGINSQSTPCTIADNDIVENTEYGIGLSQTSNTMVRGNRVIANAIGISVTGTSGLPCRDIEVAGNEVRNNRLFGLEVTASEDVIVKENRFVANNAGKAALSINDSGGAPPKRLRVTASNRYEAQSGPALLSNVGNGTVIEAP
jgi:parallel beta-helix repeat protein